MAFFDTNKQRAAIILLLLAVGIAIALAPYVSGLLGARCFTCCLRRSIAGSADAAIHRRGHRHHLRLPDRAPGVWLIGMLVGRPRGAN
jgi:hypothetical protein